MFLLVTGRPKSRHDAGKWIWSNPPPFDKSYKQGTTLADALWWAFRKEHQAQTARSMLSELNKNNRNFSLQILGPFKKLPRGFYF